MIGSYRLSLVAATLLVGACSPSPRTDVATTAAEAEPAAAEAGRVGSLEGVIDGAPWQVSNGVAYLERDPGEAGVEGEASQGLLTVRLTQGTTPFVCDGGIASGGAGFGVEFAVGGGEGELSLRMPTESENAPSDALWFDVSEYSVPAANGQIVVTSRADGRLKGKIAAATDDSDQFEVRGTFDVPICAP